MLQNYSHINSELLWGMEGEWGNSPYPEVDRTGGWGPNDDAGGKYTVQGKPSL